MIHFTTKAFKELSTKELYDLLRLRSEVFVVEQDCVYQDIDSQDVTCFHVLGYEKDRLAAYARLLSYEPHREASIGRVVVDAGFRKSGYGKELMKYSIAEIMKLYDTNDFVISAQQYLEKFYLELGFTTESEMYLEDGIPHIKMRYQYMINTK